MAEAATLSRDERERLYERTGGVCDWCGMGMRYEDMDAHHRKLRRRGGTWALSNIAGVHHDCHVNQPGSIHMNPNLAERRGFMLSQYAADTIPLSMTFIQLHGQFGPLVHLHDDGTTTPAELPF